MAAKKRSEELTKILIDAMGLPPIESDEKKPGVAQNAVRQFGETAQTVSRLNRTYQSFQTGVAEQDGPEL